MWGSIPALETVATLAFWAVTISSGVALLAGAALTITSDRIADLTKTEADIRISEAKKQAAEAIERAAEANKQAEEAKAETAKTNERLKSAQEARRLSRNQIGTLDFLFRSDVFQKPKPKQLRVSSVEDAEARMFAMELQNLMKLCGVNIYPTDGGLPSTCVQLDPESPSLVLAAQSAEVSSEMQHLAHFERVMLDLGFEMQLVHDANLRVGEGVLHVMRKKVV